jgi:Domain of unknown function (DUF4279)
MTNFEPRTLRTFASLRFMGDRLEPARITAVLGIAPTTAYRKGEIFKRGRGHDACGRTGVWVLSSDGHVADRNLDTHLRYLLAILYPGGSDDKLRELCDLMREEELTADVMCFWYGKSGAQVPAIAKDLSTAFARLPAEIATDFHTE